MRPNLRSLSDWTVGEIALILGADEPQTGNERKFAPISSDSRTAKPGEFFLALKGEKFDAHEFCPMAVQRGAGGLIARRDYSTEFDSRLPVLRVDDPLRAYGSLARFQREAWGGKLIALSGSVGKTTTRRLISRALSPHLKILEPIRNFNNLIGVPQTLLQLQSDHEVAVMELGMNQPGELARLTEICRPDVAGLTRIGMTHVGMFHSLDELIEAKLSLFASCPPGTPLVVNAGCANSRRALTRFADTNPITTFQGEVPSSETTSNGRGDPLGRPSFWISNVSLLDVSVGYRFDLNSSSASWRGIRLRHFGRQYLEDVACAAAMLSAGGFDPGWIIEAVENFQTESLRGQILETQDLTLILDCYNAAPDSMAASLDSLREFAEHRAKRGRLVIVLADMLELGSHSRSAHGALLPHLRPLAPALFFGLGPESSRLAETLNKEKWDAHGFSSADEMASALKSALQSGDQVFFKGSHGFALEKVAQKIAPELEISH